MVHAAICSLNRVKGGIGAGIARPSVRRNGKQIIRELVSNADYCLPITAACHGSLPVRRVGLDQRPAAMGCRHAGLSSDT